MKRQTKAPVIEHKGAPEAILCADIHLMEASPVCRLDEFVEETQWEKIRWLKELARSFDCPVFHAGDLFHFWKPSPELLSRAIEELPKNFYTVYGNHDLPQHSMELAHKSGVHTLEKAKALTIFKNGHWGEAITEPTMDVYHGRAIRVQHVMTYQGTAPYPGCTAPRGATLLRKHPQFDLILTGDNHVPFVEYHEGRVLVNPGSLFRITAVQTEHRPRVYLYYPESNTVEAVFVPIKDGVISTEHIASVEERDARIGAFVSSLENDWEAGTSFQDNLRRFCEANAVGADVLAIINRIID